MPAAKSIEQFRIQNKRTSKSAQSPRHCPTIDPKRLQKERVHVEAARRAAFVRGMGGSLTGYCEGYRDGFEHAIQWLLDPSVDPLALDYRSDSGMKSVKQYHSCNPVEKAKVLEWFQKIVIKPPSQK
jgi:hypothetical protein